MSQTNDAVSIGIWITESCRRVENSESSVTSGLSEGCITSCNILMENRSLSNRFVLFNYKMTPRDGRQVF
uniref:Uncharacterized protein n=1 Tax=Rhizophora mucronata TaxID=61149 RepID=A0A2P2KVL5_RHIMU